MLIRRDEHNIDKVFRQKLHDAGEEVPMHLWEGIRSKSKSRRFVFFMWFSAALMVAGLLVTQGGPNKTSSYLAGKNEIVKNPSAPEMATVIADQTSGLTGENSPVVANYVDESTTSKPLPAEQTEEKKSVVSKQKSKEKTSSEPAKQNTNAAVNKSSKTFKGAIDKQQNAKKAALPAIDIIAPFIVPGEISSIGITPHLPSSLDGQMDEDSSPDHLPMSNASYSQMEEEVLNDESLPMVEAAPVILPKQPSYSKFGVGVYYAVYRPQHLASRGGSDDAFNALSNRTSVGVGQGVGIGLSYFLRPNVSVMLGLESSSFNEDHSWIDTTGYLNYVEDITYSISYPAGDTSPVVTMIVDTVVQDARALQSHSHRNTYSAVSMPLLLGYHYKKSRWTLGVQAGPVFRLSRNYMGSFVFPTGGILSADPGFNQGTYTYGVADDSQVYLNKYYASWKMDLHIGLNAGFAFWRNWSLNAGVFYRQSTRIIDKGNPLAHRMIQPGASIGIGCTF